ncbi:alpha/beta fold hydrolase [Microbacterium sp. YY-01]|uniref:alpha/beta fold hydrolase n=1 Tax=Microbacterium sp. YY-01 TaxID=3421634 RepID=UPI003D172203
MMAAMETKYLDGERGRLAWDEHGEGPVVIVAHGMARSRRADRQYPPLWDDMAESGFRVVSYDAHGHGESSSRAVEHDFRWPQLAHDLLALADAVSPSEPVYAVGTSMGTGTIVHALTQRPERFRSVTLAAPPTAWSTRPAQARVYRTIASDVATKTETEFHQEWVSGPRAPIFTEAPPSIVPHVAFDLIATMMHGCANSDLPAPELVAQITVPALILAWATDPAHPLSTAQELARLMPHATMRVAETLEAISAWPAQAAQFFGRVAS